MAPATNNYLMRSLAASVLAAALMIPSLFLSPAVAATYYSDQTNFAEDNVPLASYSWTQRSIKACIYKDADVPNSYYVWTKLAVQKWRQALREYTDNQDQWTITARYVRTQAELESCDVKIYIFESYKDFHGYPSQTGAYTSVKSANGQLDAGVFLSPFILHGDGRTEINLPTHAFRNSATHEIGHVLGLGHMNSEQDYLMSPQFDFVENERELRITTLELRALVSIYGEDGFQP